MPHLHHLSTHKHLLELRFHIIRLVRDFFWSKGFLEVETPLIVRLPGQEPYLSPAPVTIHNEREEDFFGYLHTSPEYTMKKMLAAGFEKIFFLGKCFRDYESFGGAHNPEFTMLEWYRAKASMWEIMEEVEQLFRFISQELKNQKSFLEVKWQRVHMRDLWSRYAKINLDDYLGREQMLELCRKQGYQPREDESYEDLFYRIFLNEIEPHLGKDAPTIVHHYPVHMAALAKLSDDDPRYAERFEVYIDGLEIANAFSEITDAVEQKRRLEKERQQRAKLGKAVYDIDEEFIAALDHLPPSGGIALGVDRMVMVLAGCQEINNVVTLSAAELFLE